MQLTRQKLIQLIHIAKSQFRVDDESYRLILNRTTGKNSCKACTVAELMQVLAHFEKIGFKVKRTKRKTHTYTTPTNSKISYKIRAIWDDMAKNGFIRDPSEKSLNAFVRKVVNTEHKKVLILNINALDNSQATMVLERLKKWQARVS